jgi:hypothetical protein
VRFIFLIQEPPRIEGLKAYQDSGKEDRPESKPGAQGPEKTGLKRRSR